MAFVKEDRVRETSTTAGTGSITTGGAPGGYQSFGSVMSIGDTCWYAFVMPGAGWETGLGTYTGLNTLARTTVFRSSNAGALVSFPAGSKDVFICQPASKADFPPGTLMLFQQTASPSGWTKQTTHNDKTLRVVSGAASSGGTNPFSTVNNQTVTVNNTTITQSTMASHSHTSNATENAGTVQSGSGAFNTFEPGGATINSTGADGAHSHGITIAFAVAYVDLIIASKDT
jgi:hypothetical protein